jgi:hypothetical protein
LQFRITPAMREKAAGGMPMFSLATSMQSGLNSAREIALPAGYQLGDLFNSNGRLNWWHCWRSTGRSMPRLRQH